MAIASALVWIIAVVAMCAVLSVAGALWLMWWHRKQAGRRRARPQRALRGKAVPRAARVPPPQAIEHHGQEFHIYGADGQEAAALIRKALNGGHQP